MKIFTITIFAFLFLNSCQKKETNIEINDNRSVSPDTLREVETPNYGTKLFANLYLNMNRTQYFDSLQASKHLFKYHNYDGNYMIFDESEHTRFSIEPTFNEDRLEMIILNVDGDIWIKDRGEDISALSKKMTENILRLYSNKYRNYRLSQYNSSRLFDDTKYDLFIWETDSMNIEFDPHKRTILYKPYSVVAAEKKMEENQKAQREKDKQIDREKIITTEKNI